MRRFRWYLFLASVGLLSGCASNILEPFISSDKAYGELYLRGVFTWWEADPKYKLQETEPERYATTIKLIADGQPYDFKFADQNWTPGLNCGYLSQEKDQLVSLERSVSSSCDATDQNFKFIPSETGVYQFSIDFADPAHPRVLIKKISI